MKSVLINIKSKYCELIANGQKTVEIRGSMTVKQWLNRGWKIDREINQILQAQHDITNKNCEHFEQYSTMINDRIDELYTLKREILSAIGKVDNRTFRTLLIARYINFYTWEKIADNMNYSREWIIRKIHPQALKAVGEVIPLPRL